MAGRTVETTLALLCVASLLAAAAALQSVRERAYPPVAPAADALYVTSPEGVRRLSLGYQTLAADLYWIRAIQYYGGTRMRFATTPPGLVSDEQAARAFEGLYPLLDLTTTLDPRFNIAYRFGAIFLAEPFPNGAGRPDQAVALLEKGQRAWPEKWEYLHDIGFVYYWNVQDYEKAASYFNRAADLPGAPWWLRGMAATTLARGGQRSASRMLWSNVYETADNDSAREAAYLKLQQLDTLDQIEELQAKVDGYIRQAGQPPASWTALAAAGIVPGVPLDPRGMPYELSPDGEVGLSPKSPLFPLPVEPRPRDVS
jgi:hypothetical protein